MDILDYYHFSEHISSSGLLNTALLEQIASEDYSTVVNLAMPNERSSLANESSIVTALGMSYVHIPVPFCAPSETHFRVFAGCMDALMTQKTWVHGFLNLPTSAFLFRYLQSHRGWSASESATPILIRWLPTMDDAWRTFLGYPPDRLWHRLLVDATKTGAIKE